MLDPKILQWYRAYGSEEAKLGKEETKEECLQFGSNNWLSEVQSVEKEDKEVPGRGNSICISTKARERLVHSGNHM